MKIDWTRVIRTTVQATIGGAIAFLSTISEGVNKQTIITSLVTLIVTIGIAFLMNIKEQIGEDDDKGYKS